jgi:hypothetical protein
MVPQVPPSLAELQQGYTGAQRDPIDKSIVISRDLGTGINGWNL